MANNKVQLANGTVLIDLTDTTAVASDVAAGKYFYTADGIKREGTATAGSVVITETEDSHGGTIVNIVSTDVVRLHSKSATPSTSSQTILPDSGYDGLSQVTVGAIPSEYIVPAGTKTISITENGTIVEDVTAYANASITVDVDTSNDFAVEIVWDETSEKWVPTKTLAEIGAAYNAGKTIAVFSNECVVDGNYDNGEFMYYAALEKNNGSVYSVDLISGFLTSSGVTNELYATTYRTSDADALPENVINGKVFYNANGRQVGTYAGSTPTLQSKSVTVTPSASTQSQTVSPDTGYDGLSSVSVTVNPIPSEYVVPTGTLAINQNGTVDVSQYANVTVNVPSSGGVGLVTQDAEGYVVFDDGEPTPSGGVTLDEYVDAESTIFTGPIVLNTADKISAYALYSRTGITSLTSSSVRSIRSYGCAECSNMTIAVLKVGAYISNNAFHNCSKLASVDLAGEPLSFDYSGLPYTNCFNGCSALKTLVIRSSFVTKLNNINNFTNSPFASGKSGGTLYVPSALIADYQAATNWSTILGYANNSIVAIEGSIYENAYVDGSVISA